MEDAPGGGRDMGNLWRFAFAGTAFFWLIVVLALELIPAHAADLGSLTIRVQNVSPRGGILRLGLYDEANYPDDTATAASADVAARPGETVITLTGIKPGTYAIEAYQDINSNDKMDTSWLGLPLEPYGFSRDARPVLSKPGFRKVSFQVLAGMNEQVLHLQNSPSGTPDGNRVADRNRKPKSDF
jgi:uncharacterized protein (DUF2141 family)